jgi:TniQ
VFESWDLAIKPLMARSRLYPLAPAGVGTALVESLSGYVVRLAEAHAVSTADLIHREVSRFLTPAVVSPATVSYAINGLGESAKRWVQAVEVVTLRSDIHYLTLLPFERLFPRPFLFRDVRAWCPACYGIMSAGGGPIYEPLLWCLKLVEVCPRHRRPLATTCPHCHRRLRPLAAASRTGFCSRCGLWLGRATDRTTHDASHPVPTEYQFWLAAAMGELLANASQIQSELLRDRVKGILSAYADAFAEGNRTAIAEAARCRRGVFYSWFKGNTAARIDTFLRTWYELKLPVSSLFADARPELSAEVQEHTSLEIRKTRKVAPKRSREQRRAALERAVNEQPAPSLPEMARRLGYTSTTRLYAADSALCKKIVLNHRRSGRSHWWMRRGAKPLCEPSRINEVLETYLARDNPIPPLDRIAIDLGYAIDLSLRRKFPELCRALSAKIAEQKKARTAAIEPALEHALQETPPPSLRQMAKRLELSAACILQAHAPALCEQLLARRLAYSSLCRAELGRTLKTALEENPPPSLKRLYSRLGVTESIVSTSFPELRQAIGSRHRQHQEEQAHARREAVREEIREVVRTLHEQGVCPSVPRVRSLLKNGSLRDWTAMGHAVNAARRTLMGD